MRETWYLLEDGTPVNPAEVAPNDKGALMHKSGSPVAIGAHGNPKSRSVDVEEEMAKRKKPATRELTADKPKAGYQTRESKAD